MSGGSLKSCQKCGIGFERPKGLSAKQWESRRFCSVSCGAMKERISDEEIVTLYISGLSSTQISEKAHISAAQVARIVSRKGALRNASDRIRLSHNREDVRRKISDSKKGRPCSEDVKEKLSKRTGPKNHNWRGGIQETFGGYLAFTASEANGVHAGRSIHRIIAEWKYGRDLRHDEHVHHVDGDKLNNHPDNLVVMSASEHAIHHNDDRIKGLRKWLDQ